MIGPVLTSIGLAAALFITMFVIPYAWPTAPFNLFLASVIAALLFGNLRLALIIGLAGSLLVDLVSPTPFGNQIIAMAAAIGSIRWMSRTRLTNRSLPAYLALTGIGISAFYATGVAAGWMLQWLEPTALATRLSPEWVIMVAVNCAAGLIFGILVYTAARVSGRSYAKLARYEF